TAMATNGRATCVAIVPPMHAPPTTYCGSRRLRWRPPYMILGMARIKTETTGLGRCSPPRGAQGRQHPPRWTRDAHRVHPGSHGTRQGERPIDAHFRFFLNGIPFMPPLAGHGPVRSFGL